MHKPYWRHEDSDGLKLVNDSFHDDKWVQQVVAAGTHGSKGEEWVSCKNTKSGGQVKGQRRQVTLTKRSLAI